MKELSYAHALAIDAVSVCKNVKCKQSRIKAIRALDPKIDDKRLNIIQMMMMCLVVINRGEGN